MLLVQQPLIPGLRERSSRAMLIPQLQSVVVKEQLGTLYANLHGNFGKIKRVMEVSKHWTQIQ